ncbi:MAG: ribosome maturation factor RimM [Tepidiformaceae bacterium]
MGRVLRPHALKGELRVAAFSPSARNLQRGRPVYLGGVRRVVMRARQDQEAWILKLEGIVDRSEVEALRGELLEAPDTEVLREDDESFFVHELIGLKVETEDGREVGTLAEVMQPGANDVYVVKTAKGEVLIPAISEVVKAVFVREGRVVITPLAGMLDDSE